MLVPGYSEAWCVRNWDVLAGWTKRLAGIEQLAIVCQLLTYTKTWFELWDRDCFKNTKPRPETSRSKLEIWKIISWKLTTHQPVWCFINKISLLLLTRIIAADWWLRKHFSTDKKVNTICDFGISYFFIAQEPQLSSRWSPTPTNCLVSKKMQCLESQTWWIKSDFRFWVKKQKSSLECNWPLISNAEMLPSSSSCKQTVQLAVRTLASCAPIAVRKPLLPSEAVADAAGGNNAHGGENT